MGTGTGAGAGTAVPAVEFVAGRFPAVEPAQIGTHTLLVTQKLQSKVR